MVLLKIYKIYSFFCGAFVHEHIFWFDRPIFTMLQGFMAFKPHGPIPPTAVVPDTGQHRNFGPTLK